MVRGLAVGAVVLGSLAIGTPASHAIITCGYKDKPKCIEAPPRGEVLDPPTGGNPYGLQPVSAPAPGVPLFERTNGHLPYGFNNLADTNPASSPTIDEELLFGQQAGASMARIGVDWSIVRYNPAYWDYDLSDAKYLAAIRRGLRPVLMLGRSPRRFTKWHNACSTINVLKGCLVKDTLYGCPTGTPSVRDEFCWLPPTQAITASTTVPNTGLNWFRQFVQDVATRYPLAGAIEIWNEPNFPWFWGQEGTSNPADDSTPDAGFYTWMLGIARQGLDASGRTFPLLGGALANGGAGTVRIQDYLGTMLQAGAASAMTALSVHPYVGNKTPDNPDAGLRATTHEIATTYAAAGVPVPRIVATEAGIDLNAGWTSTEQRDVVRAQYDGFNLQDPTIELSDRVDAIFWHSMVDHAGEAFGWLGAETAGGFPPRPVYCEFRQQVGGFPDCPTMVAPSPNQAPVAQLSALPANPGVGHTVTFDASASNDPDGDPLRYEWDLDGDGAFESASPVATTQRSYGSTGDRTVRVRVTDRGGVISTAQVVVHVT